MTDRSKTSSNPGVPPRPAEQPAAARWLELEARASNGGDDSHAAAENALADLLRGLPQHVPGVAFAERVLLATRQLTLAPSASWGRWPGPWLSHWGARAAVALIAVQAGLLIAAATSLSRPILAAREPLGVITAGFGVLARSLEWLIDIPRFGVGLVELADGLARSLAASPIVMTGLLLCLASSALGLYLLSTLIPHPREASA